MTHETKTDQHVIKEEEDEEEEEEESEEEFKDCESKNEGEID